MHLNILPKLLELMNRNLALFGFEFKEMERFNLDALTFRLLFCLFSAIIVHKQSSVDYVTKTLYKTI